jgi:multidrug efflux pump
MNLSEICIKRPVLATVISLIMVVAGFMGYSYLQTRFFPKFEPGMISITTNYPGASANLVESSITTPLEEAISGVEGVEDIHSTSGQGSSAITVDLVDGANSDVVADKLRNKISENSDQLPTNIKPPIVQVGWGNMDLLDIGVTSTSKNVLQLRDYIERYITNRIEQLPNIASVQVDGANKYAMRIELNPKKLHAFGLGVNDIKTAITNSNIELPAGEIKANSIDYPITAKTALHNAEQFDNLIVSNHDNHIVRLSDIAKISLGRDSQDQTVVRFNGVRGINLTVFNTTDGNPINAADATLRLLKKIKTQLPSDMKMRVTFNQAVFMKASIHEVYESIFIAILCVSAIIFIFLGKLRSVLVPITTIPVCIITTFGIIYAFGFTINIISLLAIVLSIGLIVDDAIVMLENIYRHIEMGKSRMEAAKIGSREITFAVIAMTLTLAAVYAPIGLIKGKAAHIFGSFAFPLAGAVVISGIVALTLSPMMCARVLPTQISNTGYSRLLQNFFSKIEGAYQKALTYILKVRLSVITAVICIGIAGYFLVLSIPKGFMPHEDMGFLMVNINPPSGSSLVYNSRQEDLVYDILKHYPAVQSVSQFSTKQFDQFDNIFVKLKPFNQRKMSATKLAAAVNKEFAKIPSLNAAAFPPSFGGSMQHQLEFYILDSGSYKNLYKITQDTINTLKKYPGLTHIDSGLKFDDQQYSMNVNRELASRLGVSPEAVDNTVATFLGGSNISTFEMNGRDYDVYMQAEDNYLHNLDALNQFYVKNNNGKLIPLSNLVSVTPTLGQLRLQHYNRLRAALMYADLAPGYKLGQVVMYLNQHLPGILPTNAKFAFSGMAKRIGDTSSNIGIIFLLGLVFIYLVLAAQFESFLDPLIILLAVPLSIVSALAALKIMGASLNIYTAIGLLTLIGLISKHGILITQFANQLQKEGKDYTTALIEAAAIRLRPILMTTAAMVFGALPLVCSSGASANSRFQIGIVIIVGLLFGTFFSLIVIPVMYSLAGQLRYRRRLKRARSA